MKYTHIFEPIKSEEGTTSFIDEIAIAQKLRLLENTDDLIALISGELSDNVIIDGGHYPLEQKGDTVIHKPNYLTSLVFEVAVKLYKWAQSHHIKASLGFLINDLGLDADMRTNIKKEFVLHPVYLDILNKYNFEIHDITCVIYESQLRNRAARLILKNGLQNNLVKECETLLYAPDTSDTNKEPDFNNYLGHKAGGLLIPFCRAIMAQKLSDAENRGFLKAITFLTEHEFKCLGEFAKVYHLFGGRNNVVNVLFSPFELADRPAVKYNNAQCVTTADVYFLKNKDNRSFVQIQKYERLF
jgi:hypothetical protein